MKNIEITMFVGDQKVNQFMERMDLGSAKHRYVDRILKVNVEVKKGGIPKKAINKIIEQVQNHFFVFYAFCNKHSIEFIDPEVELISNGKRFVIFRHSDSPKPRMHPIKALELLSII